VRIAVVLDVWRARWAAVAGRVTLPVVLLFLFLSSWLFRFNDPNGSFAQLTDDHYFYLVRGWQILFGDMPVRDFVDHGAPLYYYVAAAVQWLGGRGSMSEIVFSVTLLSIGSVLTGWLAARASGSVLLGAAVAIGQILMAPRFYNYPKILVYTAAIPVLWAFLDRPTRRRAFWVALVTAVGFLFRHDHGAFVGVGMAVALLCVPALSLGARLRLALIYAGLVLALLAPYLLFIQVNGGFGQYIRQASAWAARDRGRAPVVFPGLFDYPYGNDETAAAQTTPGRAIASMRDNHIAWMYYGELALPLAALLVLTLSTQGFRGPPGRVWPHAQAKIAIVAVLGLVLDIGFLRSPLEARLADPSVPLAILLAWLCAAAVAACRPGAPFRPALARARRPLALAVVAVAASLVVVFTVGLSRDFRERLDSATMLEGPWTAVRRADYMRTVLQQVWPLERIATPQDEGPLRLAFYLRYCVKPSDRVLMQPYLPQVLALAERAFAGGHADLRPGFFTTDDAQLLTIARLQRQSVPVVVLETGESLAAFRASFPLITAYLDEHYRPAGERDLDDRFAVHLLVSKTAVPTRTYAPLDWPCYY
jgi:hypothetical protein